MRWRWVMGLTGLLLAGPALAVCGRYRVAFYEYAALYYRDAQGQYQGIDKDVIEELARRTGCRFDAVTESRVRIWALLEQGQLDLATSAMPTPERERSFEMLPYVQSRQFTVFHPSVERVPPTLAAFNADTRLRLLVVRGFHFVPTLDAWVEQLRADKRVVEAPDQPSALRALKAGRVEAMLIGGNTLALTRRSDPEFEHFATASYAPDEHSVGALALSRQRISAADRQLIRQALADMQQDGSLAAILRRHLGTVMPP
ncbi:substrate-binding periplasmic protein [Roseateles sp. BYS78W]|uniref:Substrate-binding periplasmic protein n=1 Tax=Pelomonas candidula TaxID=3299025 RepID=A0ABW7H6M4_9BURK